MLAAQPWAAQLKQAMAAPGVEFDPHQKSALQPAAVGQAALQHYLQRIGSAASQPRASQLRHYFGTMRPSCLNPDEYSMPAYWTEVCERSRHVAMAELCTGVHWVAEATDRLRGANSPPRNQRFCPHCAATGDPGRVDDTRHIVFECALYSDLRAHHRSLFAAEEPQAEAALRSFLSGPPVPLAQYTGACWRRAHRALGLPPSMYRPILD